MIGISHNILPSNTEHLFQLPFRIRWICHRMPYRSRVTENFPIVSAFKRLVPKEMDGFEVNPIRALLLCYHMLQTICLVPAMWKDVK